MAKRKRSAANKPSRRPKTKRPARSGADRRPRREPDLMDQVAAALQAPGPLELLAFTSQMLGVLDPRSADPFGRADPPPIGIAEFVETLVETVTRETTALLAALAVLGDDLVRVRARRELTNRTVVLPGWVADLAHAVPQPSLRIHDPLGDGEDVVVGVRLPGGDELTAVVFVDHNLGSVVKDAFVLDASVDMMAAQVGEISADEPDLKIDGIAPADARAKITQAIEHGARTYPPLTSDTWPAARALVEWLVSGLPAGGTGYEYREWSERETEELVERFLGSPAARHLTGDDLRSVAESLLWFGTGYGTCDPWRWSPTRLEILMLDWIPRKIIADAAYLAGFPDVLRALVRFGHAEVGIRPELTDEALAAIDDFEPEYLELIHSDRAQGAAALFAAMGLGDDDPEPDYTAELDEAMERWSERALERLRQAAGGAEALATLGADPLPDEPFDWADVPDDLHDTIAAVLEILDRVVGELFDLEYRTACRRLLHLVATGDPAPLRRRARADISAAALCWIVGKANRVFNSYSGRFTVQHMLAAFGVTGSVSQRAKTFLSAAGLDTDSYEMDLGRTDLLVSDRRRRIIADRDQWRDRSS